jgi:fatty acid-binding protein DegV
MPAVAGRAGATAGALLRSRPLLAVRDGQVVVLERVTSLAAAQDRLVQRAAVHPAGRRTELAVQHIGNPAAADLRQRLAAAVVGLDRAVTNVRIAALMSF